MQKESKIIEDAISKIIRAIGDEPQREGIKATPRRVAESLLYLTRGYREDIMTEIQGGIFPSENHDIVILQDMEFHSLCEHHILPFYGHVSVVYKPDNHLIGISKIAKVVDHFAARLQVQERLTAQIADLLTQILNPMALGVVVKAKHLCMSSREYKKADAIMITRALRSENQTAANEISKVVESLI